MQKFFGRSIAPVSQRLKCTLVAIDFSAHIRSTFTCTMNYMQCVICTSQCPGLHCSSTRYLRKQSGTNVGGVEFVTQQDGKRRSSSVLNISIALAIWLDYVRLGQFRTNSQVKNLCWYLSFARIFQIFLNSAQLWNAYRVEYICTYIYNWVASRYWIDSNHEEVLRRKAPFADHNAFYSAFLLSRQWVVTINCYYRICEINCNINKITVKLNLTQSTKRLAMPCCDQCNPLIQNTYVSIK